MGDKMSFFSNTKLRRDAPIEVFAFKAYQIGSIILLIFWSLISI